MIIDVDQHWKPEFFWTDTAYLNACLRCIPRAYGEHVEISDIPGSPEKNIRISRPKGYVNLNPEGRAVDIDDRLRAMDESKIDKAILRFSIWPEWLTLDLCQKANDAMAKVVKGHPDRFLGLATVPPWGDKDCLNELERCIKELGFVGVTVSAHYGTLYLDSEELRPHFKKINELNIPVIVHHTPLPVDYAHVYDFDNLRRMYGRCMDQMICVGRIVYSGMLDELPNLRFIHTMMAGGLFAYKNLITPQKSTDQSDKERFNPEASNKAVDKFDRIYSDISHAQPWGRAPLECAVKVLGAKNVVFGTSYALRREWSINGVDFVRSLEISEQDKDLILGGNAQRLFKIKE